MPKIHDLTSGRLYPLEPGREFVVGRHPAADLPVRDPSCSRSQFRIRVGVDATCYLEPLSATSPTICEGIQLQGEVELDQDVEILAGQSRFRFLLSGDPIEEVPAAAPTVVGGHSSDEPESPLPHFQISGSTVIGRDPSQADLILPHVRVSRRHARLVLHAEGAVLSDLGSSNGTYHNGVPVRQAVRVSAGDTIDIGPYHLTFSDGYLKTATREDNLNLAARDLHVSVPLPEGGPPKTILGGVSLVIRPREFVCLLGPAGCGKSTLMSALSARRTPQEGQVLLNGIDLHRNFHLLKSDLAFVPQRDLLHSRLTVDDALGYAGRLRLPPDTSSEEIARITENVIQKVGLIPQRKTQIRHLSGGQTKRGSLALELLGNPSLIFLDEVTSGLDEQSDREMMQLFRQLAQEGKTLVCVTHNLTNVEANCHLIVILAEGGNLAFVGSPSEALDYFNVARLGDVYERLKERDARQWREDFSASPQMERSVRSRLGPITSAGVGKLKDGAAAAARSPISPFRQAAILGERYFKIMFSDVTALAATFAQCLLVALLLVVVYGDVTDTGIADPVGSAIQKTAHSCSLLFIAAVSCFWFGCNNAAKEIVKERALMLKEYQTGLSLGAYYASKWFPVAIISSVQACLLYGAISYGCHLPGAGLAGLLTMIGVAIVGLSLGLTVSAMAATEEMATALVPIVLIPQIVLSGGLKPLTGLSELIAQTAVSTYWGYGLLRGTLPDSMTPYLPLPAFSTAASVTGLLLQATAFIAAAYAALQMGTRQR